MTYVPSAVRRKVWSRAGGCCELCGRELRRFKSSRGSNRLGRNLRLICAKTNLSRGDTNKKWYYNCAEEAA